MQRALDLRRSLTIAIDDYAEFKREIGERNVFIMAHHCGDPECEQAIKDETKASARCIPFDGPPEAGACVRCGQPGLGTRLVFAKAY
jgi:prolyl-tRNA synthetase